VIISTKRKISGSIQALALVPVVAGVMLLSVSSCYASFGVEAFENSIVLNKEGLPAVQAGSHPYEMATAIMFDHSGTGSESLPDGNPKNVEVNLHAGVVGNPTATATRCTEAALEHKGDCRIPVQWDRHDPPAFLWRIT
jgi:hypothetical protein